MNWEWLHGQTKTKEPYPCERLRGWSSSSAGCRPLPRRRRRVATLGHRTRLHPLDRAPPPPAAGLTPCLSPLGPGELAVERRGRAMAGESCSSSSPSPLADPSLLIRTAGEKTMQCLSSCCICSRPLLTAT